MRLHRVGTAGSTGDQMPVSAGWIKPNLLIRPYIQFRFWVKNPLSINLLIDNGLINQVPDQKSILD